MNREISWRIEDDGRHVWVNDEEYQPATDVTAALLFGLLAGGLCGFLWGLFWAWLKWGLS